MRQTVLITGVSAGLGKSLAEFYSKQQAHIYGLSRQKPDSLDEINHRCVDLAKLEDLPHHLTTLLTEVKHLDIVILNAAHMGVIEDLRDTSTKLLKEIMDINLWSNKIICDTLFNLNIKVSQVVAISSGMSQANCRGANGYALSKAALNHLIQLYAIEQPNTHFCSLAPGLINTAMQKTLETHLEQDKFPILLQLEQARNAGAVPSPNEVAQKIICSMPKFLDLPSGSYTTLKEVSQ